MKTLAARRYHRTALRTFLKWVKESCAPSRRKRRNRRCLGRVLEKMGTYLPDATPSALKSTPLDHSSRSSVTSPLMHSSFNGCLFLTFRFGIMSTFALSFLFSRLCRPFLHPAATLPPHSTRQIGNCWCSSSSSPSPTLQDQH